MKVAVLAAVACIVASVAAADPQPQPAAGDPFAGMYGNTVMQTAPDGSQIRTYINEDQSWEQHTPDGGVARGTYRWQDDHTVCFTQADPVPPKGQATACDEVHSAHKPGDSWTEKDAKGDAYRLTVVTGRR